MLHDSDFVKIRVMVPVDAADKMRQVLGDNGAGIMGKYEYASGSWRQIGRFRGMPGSNPAIGKPGQLEEVEEEVIETLCHKDKVRQVIAAVRKAHPYEEPPIDIIPRLEIK